MKRNAIPGLALVALAVAATACDQSMTGVDRGAIPATADRPDNATTATSGVSVSHFVSEGAFASLGAQSVSNLLTYVSVSRYGTPSAPATYLFYYLYDATAGALVQGGYGQIANADFSGNGETGTRLKTVVAPGPNFTISAGSGGTIDLQWRSIPGFAYSSHGTNTFQFGSFTQRNIGSSDYSTATASGTVLGYDLAGTSTPFLFASIGNNHNVTIDISR
jgi:hypothetical protein